MDSPSRSSTETPVPATVSFGMSNLEREQALVADAEIGQRRFVLRCEGRVVERPLTSRAGYVVGIRRRPRFDHAGHELGPWLAFGARKHADAAIIGLPRHMTWTSWSSPYSS